MQASVARYRRENTGPILPNPLTFIIIQERVRGARAKLFLLDRHGCSSKRKALLAHVQSLSEALLDQAPADRVGQLYKRLIDFVVRFRQAVETDDAPTLNDPEWYA